MSAGMRPVNFGHSIYLQEDPSIQNPIHKVLSTLISHKVHALLMGGQACVLYGAAEFSRDTDLVLLASDDNLALLRNALRELRCRRIALPPFEQQYLLRGHAVHFRSYHPDAMHMRVDVMSLMRGVDPFDQLWKRRERLGSNDANLYNVVSLPDLVQAKKTQRDKDWPMIRRLIEADYVRQENPTIQQVRFWLLQSRTPEMIIELAQTYVQESESLSNVRKVLQYAWKADKSKIEIELNREELNERSVDRLYWEPLRKELEDLRHMNYAAEEEV